jgi:hypothetical protein
LQLCVARIEKDRPWPIEWNRAINSSLSGGVVRHLVRRLVSSNAEGMAAVFSIKPNPATAPQVNKGQLHYYLQCLDYGRMAIAPDIRCDAPGASVDRSLLNRSSTRFLTICA